MSIRMIALFALACANCACPAAQRHHDYHALARDILRQLVEIDTSESGGRGSTPAALAMAERFRGAGFAAEDIRVVGPNDLKKNLLVRLPGNGRLAPVLLIGHLDVVDARREDWTTNPFELVERDGFFYGRGTQDMKGGDAILVTTLLRMRQEKFVPDRDIILALTADEEAGDANGVEWLLREQRDLLAAEFVLNHDGPGVYLEKGQVVRVEVNATEKAWADYELTVTNPGGHGSLPRPDNAIYSLAAGLQRIAGHAFPVELNGVTRAYYEALAKNAQAARADDLRGILASPPDSAAIARLTLDPYDNALVRTTCVATRFNAGHANNALPQEAKAVVECRILPGHSPEEVRQELIAIMSDAQIDVRYLDIQGREQPSAPTSTGLAPQALRADVMKPLERIARRMWPGAPVIATMATGGSDAIYTTATGLPTYLVSGEATEQDDIRAHGRDERENVQAFYRGVDFYYDYLRAVTRYPRH